MPASLRPLRFLAAFASKKAGGSIGEPTYFLPFFAVFFPADFFEGADFFCDELPFEDFFPENAASQPSA
jgi:hypothetical protein